MYIAAHLVRRAEHEGINAFLHEHPPAFTWPKASDEIAALADEAPGDIVASRIDLEPGGNEVRAYLDILAPEGTGIDAIEDALRNLRADLPERQNPTVFGKGAIAIRFGVQVGLERLRELQLDTLAREGLALLRSSR
jgi:hypothetical protein